MTHDPRILTSEQLYHDIVVVKEMAAHGHKHHAERIEGHIDALTNVLRECANGFPSPGQLAASELLKQIDPPPPAQTISAARLEGKARL